MKVNLWVSQSEYEDLPVSENFEQQVQEALAEHGIEIEVDRSNGITYETISLPEGMSDTAYRRLLIEIYEQVRQKQVA